MSIILKRRIRDNQGVGECRSTDQNDDESRLSDGIWNRGDDDSGDEGWWHGSTTGFRSGRNSDQNNPVKRQESG